MREKFKIKELSMYRTTKVAIGTVLVHNYQNIQLDWFDDVGVLATLVKPTQTLSVVIPWANIVSLVVEAEDKPQRGRPPKND